MSKVTKNVKVTIDTKIARTMLGIAGWDYIKLKDMPDDEVFELTLHMMECYGATTETGDTLEVVDDG